MYLQVFKNQPSNLLVTTAYFWVQTEKSVSFLGAYSTGPLCWTGNMGWTFYADNIECWYHRWSLHLIWPVRVIRTQRSRRYRLWAPTPECPQADGESWLQECRGRTSSRLVYSSTLRKRGGAQRRLNLPSHSWHPFPLSRLHTFFFPRTLFHPCGHWPTQEILLERQEATRSRDWAGAQPRDPSNHTSPNPGNIFLAASTWEKWS